MCCEVVKGPTKGRWRSFVLMSIFKELFKSRSEGGHFRQRHTRVPAFLATSGQGQPSPWTLW